MVFNKNIEKYNMQSKIPKKIHFMWFQGFDDITFPKQGNEYINLWAEKNKNWEIVLWDEKKTSDFIIKNYPKYYGCWKNLDKLVKKCDFARWLILHFYGGVYSDVDSVPTKSIDEFFSERRLYYSELQDKIIFPPWTNKKFYPKEENVIDFNPENFDLFLLSEWFKLEDLDRYVVTNCFLMGIKNFDFYLNYVNYAIHYKDSSVLESFGTWRLTRYLFSIEKKAKQKILILPQPYGYWADWSEWTYSKDIQFIDHKFFTNWADKSKEQGWLI